MARFSSINPGRGALPGAGFIRKIQMKTSVIKAANPAEAITSLHQ
jgi:hypothetical protein